MSDLRRNGLGAAALVLGLGLVGVTAWWWLATQGDTADAAEPASAPSADHRLPPNIRDPLLALVARPSPITIGEYQADTAALPSINAPLSTQIPELRAAAAQGNATAACRLAEIGMRCALSGRLGASLAEDDQPSAHQRQEAQEVRRREDTLRLDGLPPALRDHAMRVIDAQSIAQLDIETNWRRWHRRCDGAPPVEPSEAIAMLRQAALAGEPRSMARYAYGEWIVHFVGVSAVLGSFSEPESRMAWSRSRTFDQWRSEAAAVRQAGLERGDPEMLQNALQPYASEAPRMLGIDDPIDRAAALRAYAGLVIGGMPESTATLELSPEDAAEADRRADAWLTRARERERRVDSAILARHDESEVPECR